MGPVVECVLNFSEGRDDSRIRTIVGALDAKRDVHLLDCSSDPDHHRSVLTFVGPPEALLQGALSVFEDAVRLIDLNNHRGAHPRIGAVDVVPFVPLRGVSMGDCIQLANRFGRSVADAYSVPVFLYGEAAVEPERRELADIRRGQFEELKMAISTVPERRPDFGNNRLHPTAGACAVGAREFLVAFNVFLNTTNLTIAQEVARTIRESNGGLPHVRALGLFLERRGQVQISMNLVNFRATSLYRAFDAVTTEAGEKGVAVTASEIVGLIPREALEAGNPQTLMLESLASGCVLEERYRQVTGRRL